MKRLLVLGAVPLLTLASIVLAQTSGQAVLRTAEGDRPFTYVEQSGQTYVSAEEVTSLLGGTLTREANGYRATVNGVSAAFGGDSRYAVVRDDLIEMPVPPITIEGRPFVPWQFFQGFLSRASSQDVSWDAAAKTMLLVPQQRDAAGVQVSLANVAGISKVVLTLSRPVEYAITPAAGVYSVRFATPIRAPFAEQQYEDPHIARLSFEGSELRIHLTAVDVAGDAYQLDNPPRIVLDFRKAAAAAPGTAAPSLPSRPVDQPGIRTIVIDPGHGGKEVGAIGPTGVMEKDITLALSRKLAAALSRRVGARVVLTRNDDSVVSLDQRTALANQYQADLFLSVHLNGAAIKDAKGSETYFLSLEASDELARKAAEAENASGGRQNRSSELNLILWDLAQQAYLDESSRLARAVQESLNSATGVANRGVKQAPFKVLVGATMPAALIEVGFITNPEEEAKLNSDAYQSVMVDALANAVARYKSEYEARIGIAPAATTDAPPAPSAPSPSAPAPQARTEQE